MTKNYSTSYVQLFLTLTTTSTHEICVRRCARLLMTFNSTPRVLRVCTLETDNDMTPPKMKNKKHTGALRLLYNTAALQEMAFQTKPLRMNLVEYERNVKRKLRKLAKTPLKTGWRVEVYDCGTWKYHSSHYQTPYAWKTCKTAAMRSKYGYSRLVNKETGYCDHVFRVSPERHQVLSNTDEVRRC